MTESIPLPTPIIGSFGRLLFAFGTKPRVPHAHAEPQLIVHLGGKPAVFAIAETVANLHPGEAVLIRPWTAHRFVEGTSSTSRWVSILLRPEWLERSGLAPCVGNPSSGTSTKLDPRLVDRFSTVPAQARRYQPTFGDLASLIADALETVNDRRPEGRPVWLEKRVRRALARTDAQANVEDFQAAAGVSRAHLFRLFRSNLCCTPHQVVAARRLNLAICELGEQERAVQEVALDLGFSTPGHFTRFFAQHLPITPSRYREKVIVI